MLAFVISVSILCFTLAVIWSRETLSNVVMKLVFFGFSFWGAFLALQLSGHFIR